MPLDPASDAAIARSNRPVWIAFLLVCFLLTGMVGLFASYGPAIPLERALRRIETLDRVVAATPPDAAAAELALGKAGAADLLTGPGDGVARLTRAHRLVIDEALDDQAGVGARTRLMLYVVTALSAGLAVGILLIVARPDHRRPR